MKLPKTTLILVLLSLGLGGFIYFHEIKGVNQREAIKENKPQIFSFTADDVQLLSIKTQNPPLILEHRNPSERPQWLIKSPILELANDGIVSYLMDLLVQGKIERILSIPAHQLSEFNLDRPQATIDIKLKNQQTHQLILGKLDFSGNFVYAEVDPNLSKSGNINVLLVSKDFTNAVNRQLSEWRQSGKNEQEVPLPTLPSTFLPTPEEKK